MLSTYHKRRGFKAWRFSESFMELQRLRSLAPAGLAAVRQATAKDFPAIMRISQEAGVFTGAELESLRADLEACNPRAGDYILIQEAPGIGPLGFIQYSPAPITEGTWYVYWIAVSKSEHGQGIGAALLAQTEQDVRVAGGRQIVIETAASSLYDAARRFYLRRGYDLVARVPDYYSDGDDKCIFLKKL